MISHSAGRSGSGGKTASDHLRHDAMAYIQ
jgi:hypothetical protein